MYSYSKILISISLLQHSSTSRNPCLVFPLFLSTSFPLLEYLGIALIGAFFLKKIDLLLIVTSQLQIHVEILGLHEQYYILNYIMHNSMIVHISCSSWWNGQKLQGSANTMPKMHYNFILLSKCIFSHWLHLTAESSALIICVRSNLSNVKLLIAALRSIIS